MFFVPLHKPYKGNVDDVMIRGDLIMEVSTRRHTKKAAEYEPDNPAPEGSEQGCWVLVQQMGWMPVVESAAEVREAIIVAETEYRQRLASVRTT